MCHPWSRTPHQMCRVLFLQSIIIIIIIIIIDIIVVCYMKLA